MFNTFFSFPPGPPEELPGQSHPKLSWVTPCRCHPTAGGCITRIPSSLPYWYPFCWSEIYSHRWCTLHIHLLPLQCFIHPPQFWSWELLMFLLHLEQWLPQVVVKEQHLLCMMRQHHWSAVEFSNTHTATWHDSNAPQSVLYTPLGYIYSSAHSSGPRIGHSFLCPTGMVKLPRWGQGVPMSIVHISAY